jgi:hypothetical protein
LATNNDKKDKNESFSEEDKDTSKRKKGEKQMKPMEPTIKVIVKQKQKIK